ncbi:MAG: 16S rRNA (guanine(966)-N(2))-methyltransferase RsmD [Bacilli bacterium]|nr:16S rRNA (guanine(966)-N(2))-methyltransferase RsmD [Bacilli bacterium]
MKIISGKYKGRKIEGFDMVGTRPTMDRVKESLFAMIGPEVRDSTVLDLFGGTGSLGLEAISNGAKSCTFVDVNPKAIKTMKETVSKVGVTEPITYLCKDYKKALESFIRQGIQFDLIFLDPPYHLCIIGAILKIIKEGNLLKENGMIVCEFEEEKLESNSFTLYKERTYGSKNIKIYKEN